MTLVTIYSPTGELFEVPEKKATELVLAGWSTTAPGEDVEPEAWDTVELGIENGSAPFLHELASNEFGVILDKRWGRERLQRELRKLKNQKDAKSYQPEPASEEEAAFLAGDTAEEY